MIEQHLISIIIPVYRVEAYLSQCVDSVLSQDCKNLEIILVDDGSDDGCPALCDGYAALDERVIAVHQTNQGLAGAIKSGLMRAHGDYVGFVDSDDWVDSAMFAVMLAAITETESDIAICGGYRSGDGHKLRPEVSKKPVGGRILLDRNDFLPAVINSFGVPRRGIIAGRVYKLFKRALLLDNLDFYPDKLDWGEDLALSCACFCDAQRVVILSEFYPYHYRANENSITHDSGRNAFSDIIMLYQTLMRIAAEKHEEKLFIQIRRYLISSSYIRIKAIIDADGDRMRSEPRIREILLFEPLRQALARSGEYRVWLRFRPFVRWMRRINIPAMYRYRRIIRAFRGIQRKLCRISK